jgi:hypothetical protein
MCCHSGKIYVALKEKQSLHFAIAVNTVEQLIF